MRGWWILLVGVLGCSRPPAAPVGAARHAAAKSAHPVAIEPAPLDLADDAACRGSDRDAALAAIKELDDKITNIDDAASAAPIWSQLEELLARPCMVFARYTHATASPANGKALKKWWRDGHEWLLLAMNGFRRRNGERLFMVPGEDMLRKPVTEIDAPPLSPLVCTDPARVRACDAETSGWVFRANGFFHLSEWRSSEARKGADCEDVAQRSDPETRFESWTQCIAATQRYGTAMPSGHYMAPASGWLVLRGRRGHYGFCDEVRAYDLVTGAAYIAQDCGELAMGQPAGTWQKPGRSTTAGRLPLGLLREAAWMVFWSRQLETLYVDSIEVKIPPEIPIHILPDRALFDGPHDAGYRSSAETSLAWAWVDKTGKELTHGAITWPSSPHTGDRHADELIEVAERGLVEGCAPAALPPVIIGVKAPGVSPVDADAGEVDKTQEELVQAIHDLKPPSCPR